MKRKNDNHSYIQTHFSEASNTQELMKSKKKIIPYKFRKRKMTTTAIWLLINWRGKISFFFFFGCVLAFEITNITSMKQQKSFIRTKWLKICLLSHIQSSQIQTFDFFGFSRRSGTFGCFSDIRLIKCMNCFYFIFSLFNWVNVSLV